MRHPYILSSIKDVYVWVCGALSSNKQTRLNCGRGSDQIIGKPTAIELEQRVLTKR